jgi:inorganic triphosphatase YgiF
MGVEIEVKFRADETRQAAIRQAFPGPYHRIEMETTYYDTQDGALSAARMTLRRRMENGVSVCTVKTPAGAHGRGEWELECGSIMDAIPELCKLGAPREMMQLCAAGVQPVCGARFTRQACVITGEAFTAELALDRGVLTGGGKEIPLCEVELELKAGDGAAMEAFAAQFAARFGLTEEKKSKFRRAMDLAREG